MRRRNLWRWYLRHRLVHIAGCHQCQRDENSFVLVSAVADGIRVPRSLRALAKAEYSRKVDEEGWGS
jgi:hypothetical protein